MAVSPDCSLLWVTDHELPVAKAGAFPLSFTTLMRLEVDTWLDVEGSLTLVLNSLPSGRASLPALIPLR